MLFINPTGRNDKKPLVPDVWRRSRIGPSRFRSPESWVGFQSRLLPFPVRQLSSDRAYQPAGGSRPSPYDHRGGQVRPPLVLVATGDEAEG